jgi:hypothetical protein
LALTAPNPSVTPSEWMAVVRRGQLCGRINRPGYDQRQSELAPTLRPIRQKLIKPIPTGPAQRRRNVSVRQGAHDLHAFARRNQLVAAQ